MEPTETRCTQSLLWRRWSSTPRTSRSSSTSPCRTTTSLCRLHRPMWRSSLRVGHSTGGCMRQWASSGTRLWGRLWTRSRSGACGSRRCWSSAATTAGRCTRVRSRASTTAAVPTTGLSWVARARVSRAASVWRPLPPAVSYPSRFAGRSLRPTSTLRTGTPPSAIWPGLTTTTPLPWLQAFQMWTLWTSGRWCQEFPARLHVGRSRWRWAAFPRTPLLLLPVGASRAHPTPPGGLPPSSRVITSWSGADLPAVSIRLPSGQRRPHVAMSSVGTSPSSSRIAAPRRRPGASSTSGRTQRSERISSAHNPRSWRG
mmetsp:Transcript_24295/g.76433  ORF Transcript_24295/g.76433 Transcript_24295/m.76433 type:complete len:314 (-) Transcript_24295:304-1245(-)